MIVPSRIWHLFRVRCVFEWSPLFDKRKVKINRIALIAMIDYAYWVY